LVVRAGPVVLLPGQGILARRVRAVRVLLVAMAFPVPRVRQVVAVVRVQSEITRLVTVMLVRGALVSCRQSRGLPLSVQAVAVVARLEARGGRLLAVAG